MIMLDTDRFLHKPSPSQPRAGVYTATFGCINQFADAEEISLSQTVYTCSFFLIEKSGTDSGAIYRPCYEGKCLLTTSSGARIGAKSGRDTLLCSANGEPKSFPDCPEPA
jgi:hypothetical protein